MRRALTWTLKAILTLYVAAVLLLCLFMILFIPVVV